MRQRTTKASVQFESHDAGICVRAPAFRHSFNPDVKPLHRKISDTIKQPAFKKVRLKTQQNTPGVVINFAIVAFSLRYEGEKRFCGCRVGCI